MKRTATRTRKAATGPAPEVVHMVYERAGYCCELCGANVGDRRGVDHHVHHRRPRRMGGSQLLDTNRPQNLLLLCPSCHETVESQRSTGYEGGWLVRQSDDPATVPVLILGRLQLLTEDARYVDPPAGA